MVEGQGVCEREKTETQCGSAAVRRLQHVINICPYLPDDQETSLSPQRARNSPHSTGNVHKWGIDEMNTIEA